MTRLNQSRTPSFSASRRTRRSWDAMKQRVNNSNTRNYQNYGGRGITYDPAWEKLENFVKDMGQRPEGTTLDRKDNDGNYCKENCRWATATEQQNNKRPRGRSDGK